MLILDILGLLMNFVGAILLYLSGVARSLDGATGAERERQQFKAGIGVALLIIGFFLQLVGHTVTAVEEMFRPQSEQATSSATVPQRAPTNSVLVR